MAKRVDEAFIHAPRRSIQRFIPVIKFDEGIFDKAVSTFSRQGFSMWIMKLSKNAGQQLSSTTELLWNNAIGRFDAG